MLIVVIGARADDEACETAQSRRRKGIKWGAAHQIRGNLPRTEK